MKKKFIVFLLAALLFAFPVFAEETNCIGGAEGTNCATVEESLFKAGDSVTYDKEVLGSAFVAGNIASFSGNSDGILFIAGNSVDVKGESEYGLIAGNTITVSGRFIKDAFVAGNILTIDANVGRDLYAVGSQVKLTGVVDRNVFVGADTIVLENVEIMGDATISGEHITIGKGVIVNGTLKYTDGASIDSSAKIGALEKMDSTIYDYVEVNEFLLNLKVKAFSYLSLLLVFVVMTLFTPILLRGVGKDEASVMQIITYIGYALVYLILVPMASIILFAFVIGIPVALIALVIYGVTIYLAYAYAGYYIGKKIMSKSGREENALLEGLIGITILYVVSIIPVVGGFISFLARLCGIGIMLFTVYKNAFKMKK